MRVFMRADPRHVRLRECAADNHMNDIFVNYISIPGGEYTAGISRETADSAIIRGSDIKREFLYNATPGHTEILGEVMVAPAPVTGREFSAFITDTGYKTEAELDGWGWVMEGRWRKKGGVSWSHPFMHEADRIYRQNSDMLPVLQVSWNDASAYCEWLSARTNSSVRLPGEAEWEAFAALSGVPETGAREFRGGETIAGHLDLVNAMLDAVSESRCNNTGIVWEWTSDWFKSYEGGPGNSDFGEVYRVLRGGSLVSHEIQGTREYRFRRCPTARSPYYGFRTLVEKT